MHAFRVTGKGFHVGAGALMVLSMAQAIGREHKLDIGKGVSQGYGLATAKEVQSFKVGELLGLSEVPKGQLHMVEEVEPRKGQKEEQAFVRAVASFNAAAEEAELQRQLRLEEDEKRNLAEMARLQEEQQIAEWSEEWANNGPIKEKYPKVADYVAARQAEASQQKSLV